MRRRGAPEYAVLDIAVWAVPFGILGARVYHVLTSPQAYFGVNGHPYKVFYVWEGGLGIWGAVAGGALGAWIACRRFGIPLRMVADALAPGLPLAQAVGRLGNWFNNELYGRLTTVPWGLQVHEWDSAAGRAVTGSDGEPVLLGGLYHPTFLYEALWNIGVAGLVLWAERRFKLGWGRAFALYVMGYTAGRGWIEMLRVDTANEIAGLRLNVWTSIIVFIGAAVYFFVYRGKPQERLVTVDGVLTPLPVGVAVPESADVAGSADGAGHGGNAEPSDPTSGTDAAKPADGELPPDSGEQGAAKTEKAEEN